MQRCLRNLRPSFGVLWVLSLMENLGLGDKPSGRLRRIHALLAGTTKWGWGQCQVGQRPLNLKQLLKTNRPWQFSRDVNWFQVCIIAGLSASLSSHKLSPRCWCGLSTWEAFIERFKYEKPSLDISLSYHVQFQLLSIKDWEVMQVKHSLMSIEHCA